MTESDSSDVPAKSEDISTPSKLDDIKQMRAFKSWWRDDSTHSATWRKEAKEDFQFICGRQWAPEDEAVLREQQRPAIVFNRALTVIKAVAGVEINGRHEIQYLPRGTEDTSVNEVLTAGSQWMADQCGAEDEESEAFQYAVICGMGFTESRLSYDDNPQGEYIEEALNPLEMYWDKSARKKNLKDARRMWRLRKILVDDAREMFPDTSITDLDCGWAMGSDTEGETRSHEEKQLREEGGDQEFDSRREVTLLECQWWEKESYYLVAIPQMGQKIELDEAKFKILTDWARENGLEFPSVKLKRKVYKRAYIGNTILEIGPAPCKGHFSWSVVTGEPDRERGTWFGLVRVMRDPQMWANKWLSQTLHIMNSSAKGGILAEKDAFEDQRKAEDEYALPDAITFVKKGALTGAGGPAIIPKPMAQLPSGYYQLLEFAISSIRDVTGINLELLGLRDANQPGILEAQRKQAAMTVLGTMFDSLRAFRKQVGRIRLYFMQTFLADGRLMRVVGPDGAKNIPLVPEAISGDYDVIVNDAPTSPNQKEANWAIIAPMLAVFKEFMTPEVAVTVLEYSPLPSKVVEAFRELLKKNEQPNPEAEKARAIAEAGAVAKISRDQAAAEKDMATAQKTQIESAQNLSALQAILAGLGAPVAQPQPFPAIAGPALTELPVGLPEPGMGGMAQ